jgi:hypothetical protein
VYRCWATDDDYPVTVLSLQSIEQRPNHEVGDSLQVFFYIPLCLPYISELGCEDMERWENRGHWNVLHSNRVKLS